MNNKESKQIFSSPENDSRIMSIWERFRTGDTCNSDALRRLIDDSWNRCFSAQVDASRYQAPAPLPEDSLYSIRSDCQELVTEGSPVMAHAREFLSETGTVMVLTNQEGIILNLEGDTSTLGAAEDVHLLPGCSWSELACGTNAIGTALEVGQPVQIHSAEHYCAGIKRWTCSATVVRDPFDGSILGVIDVSGLQNTYNRHSLALVVTTASRIESRLAKREMELRYRLLESCMQKISSNTTDGLIIFDKRGRPVKVNDKADTAFRDRSQLYHPGHSGNISSLSLGMTVGKEAPLNTPHWIPKEWFEPILIDGQRIGTVLTLPIREKVKSFHISDLQATNTTTEKSPAFKRVIGEDKTLLEAIQCAEQLARSNVPILLLGETGVGKEVFAHGIHDSSNSKSNSFVALNCGGLSRELLTSELFGYSEGAFTGARRGGMIGKIEAANGGTLFLDEIGEMPLDLQPHFLRVLEEGEIYRIGENTPRKVKFRLVSATNRDLRKEVAEGRFRMDLFYRISVTSITIPALRERTSDISLLTNFYLDKLSHQHGLSLPILDPGVIPCLNNYAWPGNVRELRNVIERMILLTPDSILRKESLPPEIKQLTMPTVTQDKNAPVNAESKRLEQMEQEAILAAIDHCHGNMTAVARELGIAKSTLYVKLKKFGVSPVEAVRSYQ